MSKAYPYEGEVRLLRWGDSSTAGRTITLEIPPDTGDVHPFKGFPVGAKYGQRFRMQFAVILDDETTPTAPDSVEGPRQEENADRSERAKAQYASMDQMEQARVRASLMCKDWQFMDYVGAASEEEAAKLMREALRIKSRSEIATNEHVYECFLAMETSYKQSVGQMAEERA